MRISGIIVCILIAAMTSAAAAEFYTVDVDSGSFLHLRARPGKSARAVAELDDGACVQSLGETETADGYDWIKVKTRRDKTGWAATKFLVESTADCFASEPSPPTTISPTSGAVPILHYNNLLGGHAKGRWRDASALFPMVGKNAAVKFYNLAGFAGSGTIRYLYEGELCDVDAQLAGEPDSGEMYFGVGADWDAMPRAPLAQDPGQSTYINDIRDLLDARGMSGNPVVMDQLFRIDLEGDGQEEVFFSATNKSGDFSMESGHYTLVVMRKIVNGGVRTVVLNEQNYISAPGALPLTCGIAAFLDTDGDGVLEVFTTCDYYEGGTVYIRKIQGDRVTTLLSSSCGA